MLLVSRQNLDKYEKLMGVVYTHPNWFLVFIGSLSTVVGDEKLTSREDQIGLLFLYIQSDENTLPKVDKIFKTEAQTFNIFDKLIGPLQFCI